VTSEPRDWTAIRIYLLGVARDAGASDAEAEDVVQEAVVAYLEQGATGRPVPRPAAWLRLVVRRRLMDMRRRQRTRERYEQTLVRC